MGYKHPLAWFKRSLTLLLILPQALWLFSASSSHAADEPHILYMSQQDFLTQVFNHSHPDRKLLILNEALKRKAEKILAHRYPGARIRYWKNNNKTAWIFDEIGKDMPITMGIAIEAGKIQAVEILVYREERGGEVHQSFFKQQFINSVLNSDNTLSKEIDGITGATLSVNAVTRITKLALALHAHVSNTRSNP